MSLLNTSDAIRCAINSIRSRSLSSSLSLTSSLTSCCFCSFEDSSFPVNPADSRAGMESLSPSLVSPLARSGTALLPVPFATSLLPPLLLTVAEASRAVFSGSGLRFSESLFIVAAAEAWCILVLFLLTRSTFRRLSSAVGARANVPFGSGGSGTKSPVARLPPARRVLQSSHWQSSFCFDSKWAVVAVAAGFKSLKLAAAGLESDALLFFLRARPRPAFLL
mmetsp:Transcript_7598/g.13926  ORF Transcript_7598/g.13926 Transcript_7598/m.13926 type:complete len:222 (+) Transcript_7598:1364-2029(+)